MTQNRALHKTKFEAYTACVLCLKPIKNGQAISSYEKDGVWHHLHDDCEETTKPKRGKRYG